MTTQAPRAARIQHTVVVPASIPMVNIVGVADEVLLALEAAFPDVEVHARGNQISLTGEHADLHLIEALLDELVAMVRSGAPVSPDTVARSVAILRSEASVRPAEVLTANILSNRGKTIRPKTLNQKRYVDAIDNHTIVFGIGPAGTGKTYLAVAKAVQALQSKKVNRIVLTRPAVEAGERLGFLPGTLSEKIDPYLRPLHDALRDMLDPDSIPRLLTSGTIEVAPLAYMRGRTLNDSFVILDEAQNTTPEQMKMFLTRLGFGATMVVTGDVTQVDLPNGTDSGLKVVQSILDGVRDLSFCHLTSHDVVRHSLVTDIVEAYGRYDATRRAGSQQAGRSLMAVVELGSDAQGAPTGWPGVDAPALVDQAQFLLDHLGMHPECELVISLVEEADMSELHERWMAEPGPTDVLSFPMDELRVPPAGGTSEPGVLGDVVLCPAVAARQAAVAGHNLDGELALLLTHGILHLLGYDHELPADHREMFALQADLIQLWHARGGPRVSLPSVEPASAGPEPAV